MEFNKVWDNFTTKQKNMILFIADYVSLEYDPQKIYSFSLPSFYKGCGLNYRKGSDHRELKALIKETTEASTTINGISVRWIQKATIDKNREIIEIELDKDIVPHLLRLKEVDRLKRKEADYLSIADFSDAVGVSKQAIYKRQEKDLAPFIKVINGRKCLSTEAFELFKVESTVEQRGEKTEKDRLSFLILQLEEKDRLIQQQQSTISEQTAQLQELQRHIMDQSKDLTDLLGKQNQLQENYQILLKQHQDIQRLLSPDDSAFQQSERVVHQVAEKFINGETTVESKEPPEPGTERKGFFKRLFNR